MAMATSSETMLRVLEPATEQTPPPASTPAATGGSSDGPPPQH